MKIKKKQILLNITKFTLATCLFLNISFNNFISANQLNNGEVLSTTQQETILETPLLESEETELLKEPVNEPIGNADKKEVIEKPPVIDVVFPDSMTFSIDPFFINSETGIYSDEYTISNYSNKDCVISIPEVNYNISYPGEFDPANLNIYLNISFMNEFGEMETLKIPVVAKTRSSISSFVLKASIFNEDNVWQSFNVGSTATLSIIGEIDPMLSFDMPILWEELFFTVNSEFKTAEFKVVEQVPPVEQVPSVPPVEQVPSVPPVEQVPSVPPVEQVPSVPPVEQVPPVPPVEQVLTIQ